MYIKRTIEKSILVLANSFPCLVVYGPRQVGKSTTLDYVFPDNFNRVTLDDLDDRNLAKENPRLFIACSCLISIASFNLNLWLYFITLTFMKTMGQLICRVIFS